MELEVLRRAPARPASVSPLLFVHGVSHGAWCWEDWAEWFSGRGREVSALSLRGHGASAGRDSLDSFGLDDYRDDVLDVARTMDRPILVGHSMGGAVAQLAVAAGPTLFGGLVLLASPPPDGLRLRKILPLLLRLRGLLGLRRIGRGRPLTAREVQGLPFIDGRISDAGALLLGQRLQRESKKAAWQAGRFRAPRFEARMPVLVLGSARDRLLALSALKRTARHYAADLIVLSSSSHELMLDSHWQEAATRLDGWLEARRL